MQDMLNDIEAIPGEEETAVSATAAVPPVESAPVEHGALVRNVVTVALLIGLPIFGIIAVWTISSWNRRAKIVVTAIFVIPAFYAPFLVIRSLMQAAL